MQAQLVTNGSVSGAPCANSGINGGNAAGWSGCGFSPDLCCLTMPSYVASSSVTPVVSPDGGTWLGLAALGECAQTTITGLTIGNTYTLYFCGACFGTGTSIYNQGPSKPRITIGASIVTFTIPMAASTWNGYSMTFVANATTMTMKCDHPTGSVSYASLDGFNLSSPTCALVLPIELISFGATYDKKNKRTELNWVTAIEKNVKHFTIQKSKNAYDFENVATLPSQNKGEGSKTYVLNDNNRLDNGIVYYRLMTTDYDGSTSFSDLVDVNVTDIKDDFYVYPNPANNKAIVSYYSDLGVKWEMKLMDTKGKIVDVFVTAAQNLGVNKLELNLGNYDSGLYFISLSNNTQTYKITFVKE